MKVEPGASAPQAVRPSRLAGRLPARDERARSQSEPQAAADDGAPPWLPASPPPAWPRIFPSL
jgi:hypothetical protein